MARTRKGVEDLVSRRASGALRCGPSTGRHWDEIYSTRQPDELTWHQQEPKLSLRLIDGLHLPCDAALIDVGGGGSTLWRRLRSRGFTDLTVLDVSAEALTTATGWGDGERIQLIHHDVLEWIPAHRYDLWHDRALFHFLTQPADRQRYLDLVHSALGPSGWVVMATFAEAGPEQCSGLPTCRYSPSQLASLFGGDFRLVTQAREKHRTPGGAAQPFTWVVLRRRHPVGVA